MMRGGTERARRGGPRRPEARKKQSGWGISPLSRRLWVGNLSPRVTERMLSEEFVRFGEIDYITHDPRRSYAFVNFMRAEEAEIASRDMQGAVVGGAPIRIEFAKERHAVTAQEDSQLCDIDHLPVERGASHLHREFRPYQSNPERPCDKIIRGDQNAEPNKELWIGFPSTLKVDEVALRRDFSPFGEIDKITFFPGRNYAFVCFKSLSEACRAKKSLQGKLFNNPSVSICFAKNDFSSAAHARIAASRPSPPHLNTNFHQSRPGAEALCTNRSFDAPNILSPQYNRNLGRFPGDFRELISGKNIPDRAGQPTEPTFGGAFDMDLQRTMPVYEHCRGSPWFERGTHYHHDLPLVKRHMSPQLEDTWRMDDDSFPLSKKLRTDPLSQRAHAEHLHSDIKEERSDTLSNCFTGLNGSQNFRGGKSFPFDDKGHSDHLKNPTNIYTENTDWGTHQHFNIIKDSQQSINSESSKQLLNAEWKWEGVIAKGGTPFCRARCFPVGKSLDFMLPDCLNCTARTNIDMLEKYYYEAAGTWVVFFVPLSDSDITFYNEFMHYLGDKQRAAVAKLDGMMTLFIVPPSEFSERVLKVPGKLSISGVILKFQQSSTNFHHPLETLESRHPSLMQMTTGNTKIVEERPFRKPDSPGIISSFEGSFKSNLTSLPPNMQCQSFPTSGPELSMGKPSDFRDGRNETYLQQSFSQLSNSNQLHDQISSIRTNFHPHSSDSSIIQRHTLVNPAVVQDSVLSNFAFVPYNPNAATMPVSSLPSQHGNSSQSIPSVSTPQQTNQFTQLTSSLRQQKHLENEAGLPLSVSNKQPSLVPNPSGQIYASMPSISMPNPSGQTYAPMPSISIDLPQPIVPLSSLVPHIAHTSHSYGSAGSHPGQQQEETSHLNAASAQSMQQVNQLAKNSTSSEPSDPQKRLQATLKLAASLLKQIQQQTKSTNE